MQVWHARGEKTRDNPSAEPYSVSQMKNANVLIPTRETDGYVAISFKDNNSFLDTYCLKCRNRNCNSYFLIEECFACGSKNGFVYGYRNAGKHLYQFMMCMDCKAISDSYSCSQCGRHNAYGEQGVLLRKKKTRPEHDGTIQHLKSAK